jgi:hypothetical protein
MACEDGCSFGVLTHHAQGTVLKLVLSICFGLLCFSFLQLHSLEPSLVLSLLLHNKKS